MANRMVLIRNNAGVEYAVYPARFEHESHTTYHGFKIVSWEDGTPFEGPKTAAAIDKAHEADEPAAEADQPAPRARGGKKQDGE